MSIPEYYSSLLPYQTRGLPNAVRQVQLWCDLMTGEGLPQQVVTAFDLDTAIGAQLDVIGKYVGVARNVGLPATRPYFGFWTYASSLDPALYQGTWVPSTDTPTLPAASGGNTGFWYVASASGSSTAPITDSFVAGDVIKSNGSVWSKVTTYNGNGLTSYVAPTANTNGVFYSYQYASGQNTDLTDSEYRTVIKLKIVQNMSDNTLASIQAYLHQFFNGLITVVDNKDMTMTYSVVSTVSVSPELLLIYLPHPMGVGITVNGASPPITGMELTTEAGVLLTTEGGLIIIT